MEKIYLKRIYIFSIIILIIGSINLLFNIFSNVKIETKKNNNEVQDDSSSYDVSMFNELTIDDLVKLFDNKKDTYVVYLGRPNCSACVSFLPTLQDMQSKYGFVTQYLDIRTVDGTSSAYEKLLEKLDVTKTLNVNGEEKTDSFGNFFGYTPMVFVVSKGKFVDGFVGAYSKDKFEAFLNNNGIK